MDASVVLNISALVVSCISLGVSAVLARRQAAIMQHANALPVVVELTQDFRSQEFQRAEDYVLTRLAEHSPQLGTSGLPDDARRNVTTVFTLYNSFAVLVGTGAVDEVLITMLFGYRADRVWTALEPYIRREREIRAGNEFGAFLEDLVCRYRARPWSSSHNIELRRLTAS